MVVASCSGPDFLMLEATGCMPEATGCTVQRSQCKWIVHGERQGREASERQKVKAGERVSVKREGRGASERRKAKAGEQGSVTRARQGSK